MAIPYPDLVTAGLITLVALAVFWAGWLLGSYYTTKRYLSRLEARFSELRHFLTGEIE